MPRSAEHPLGDTLPREYGSYALVMHADEPARVQVGKVGTVTLRVGWYVYVGSAFGPGGLAARVGRHLRREKRARWHIDYLRDAMCIRDIWISTEPRRLEHEWAKRLQSLYGCAGPLAGLGCSDCHCASHVFYTPKQPSLIDVLDSNAVAQGFSMTSTKAVSVSSAS